MPAGACRRPAGSLDAMFVVLALLFVVVPIAELWVIVSVAGVIGVPETILLVIVMALVGTWLMKRAGLGVLRRISERTSKGELPTDELVDGALILSAGALMLTPGFITDVVGILFLLPPTRAIFRPAIKRWAERKVQAKVSVFGASFTSGGGTAQRTWIDGAYIDVDGSDRTPGSGRPRGDDPQGPPALGQ